MKILFAVVFLLYVVISVLPYFVGKKENIKHFIKTSFYVGGSVISLIAIVLYMNSHFSGIILQCIGLFVFALCAVHNGYIMYGKPNWKHHIIRWIISVAMIILLALTL